MQRILITGALGYLGKIVLRKLHRDLQSGKIDGLVAMDVKPVDMNRCLSKVTYIQADIRDSKLWEQLAKNNITTVIHLAAIIDSQSSSRAFQYEVDVLGTQNLLEACVKTQVKRVIISSSGAAYGYHPDNPAWLKETHPTRGNDIFAYAAHKRLVEEMLEGYRQQQPQLEQIIFRVCTILGHSTENLITNLFDKKRILGIKGYASPYVFIWDEDVAACMQQAVYSKVTGIYNLAGDGAICNEDLAIILDKPYLALSARLLRVALAIGNRLGITQYGTSQLLFIQYRPVLDNTKLKTVFGYTPKKNSLETFLFYLKSKKKTIGDYSNINILEPPK